MTLRTRKRFARYVLREQQLKAGQAGSLLPARELIQVLLLWLAMVLVLVLIGFAVDGVWHGWG